MCKPGAGGAGRRERGTGVAAGKGRSVSKAMGDGGAGRKRGGVGERAGADLGAVGMEACPGGCVQAALGEESEGRSGLGGGVGLAAALIYGRGLGRRSSAEHHWRRSWKRCAQGAGGVVRVAGGAWSSGFSVNVREGDEEERGR
ncbi:uncharacterized protein A4U43_C02F14840 [Asparagus officinalis]|uniref:Uncharacterized protein n=1 Tax=Asparagus officinalis TaxID=4686 RepID=A0A5P1FIJ0_ASPOF|nr:uncharacterized protein A4U43_C02F14840 [Asparagus officinalis]